MMQQQIHNATMHMLQNHHEQLGNFMNQQNMNQRQMLDAIHSHMQQREQERRHKATLHYISPLQVELLLRLLVQKALSRQ